jgi:APA family basic amino acid/polyamine antiporter
VSAGVLLMRKSDPNQPRPFRTPMVPFVPLMGVLICSGLIVSVDSFTQLMAGAWMLIGFVIYFLYSRNNSKLLSGE